MQMDEEREIIDRYLAGDREALTALVEQHQRRLFGFVYMMTGEMETAKDLTQETLLKMVRALPGFRGEAAFGTWLFSIAVNTVRMHFRRRTPRRVPLDERTAVTHDGGIAALAELERRRRLRRRLDDLPERQRAAVLLRAYAGLSCRETAAAMGCTEGAVKAHYHHSVRRLRRVMREAGYDVEPS